MVMGNLACINFGSTMVYPDFGFNPVQSVHAIEKERCTGVYGVPTMFLALLREQEHLKKDLSSLRTGIVAGSLCSPELMGRIDRTLKIRDMTNCYGMTETSPVSFQLRLGSSFDKKCSTVGTVHPHTEAKLIDSNGQTVPRGVVGEVCTRGYLVMKEYWGNPKATAEAIDSEGWMRTGDLGVLDDDGFLSIVGRIKDMIIRGGENIYPSEIENFLCSHPDIEDVQVFGVPHPYFGEEVCAWVRMKPDKAPLTRETVRAYCNGQIAHYKIPTKVKIVESFPLTVTGKVMKFLMRTQQETEDRQVH
jgi:fatty-acyl-CoA synthase